MIVLGIDTETTGVHTQSNLLSLNMSVVNIDTNSYTYTIEKTLDLNVKPIGNHIEWSVQAQALKVNGIDLYEHEKIAMPYDNAKHIIYDWLKDRHKEYGLLTPFGNCVDGDINKIVSCVISLNSWSNFVDRRTIELITLGKTLQLLGKIPDTQSLSLSGVASHLKIQINDDLIHTADYDVELGAQILCKYLQLLQT
jgi:hypothetical protein